MKIYTDKQIQQIKSEAQLEGYNRHSNELKDDQLDSADSIENAIKARSECPPSFNFNDININVFSVERMGMPRVAGIPNRNEHTNIGYTILDENKTVITKQWVLYCSREDHNKLVAEFNDAKKSVKQEKSASKKSLIKG
jgi:hypothetical protein